MPFKVTGLALLEPEPAMVSSVFSLKLFPIKSRVAECCRIILNMQMKGAKK